TGRPGLSQGIEDMLHTYSAFNSYHEKRAATSAKAKHQAANGIVVVNSPQDKLFVGVRTTQELQQLRMEAGQSFFCAMLLALAVSGGFATKALYTSRSDEARKSNTPP